MNQTSNPLDQLRDIHLPQQIEQFQLAPGWWFVASILLLALIYLIIRWNKKRKALYLLVPANKELEQIASLSPDSNAIARLSALLKRVCLVYFPKQQVAAITGDNWTQFLNQQVNQPLFDETHQRIFSQIAYQANLQIEQKTWKSMIDNSRIAINTIIRQQVKEQMK